MTNFQTIQERLLQGDLRGDEIATYRNWIAVMLARDYEKYGECLSFRAEWTTTNRKNSQAETERAYESTEIGKEETKIKYRVKAYEAVQEALTSLWFAINREEKEAGAL